MAVSDKAQLLMDCVSDMITFEGVEGMQRMVEAHWFRLHDMLWHFEDFSGVVEGTYSLPLKITLHLGCVEAVFFSSHRVNDDHLGHCP